MQAQNDAGVSSDSNVGSDPSVDPAVGADGTVSNDQMEFDPHRQHHADPGMATIDVQTHIDQDQINEIALGGSPSDLKGWLMRLWWVYPVGLVLFIQILACVRIRQIRRIESSYH